MGDEISQNRALRPAVFFDRDGTLIVDSGYLALPDDVVLLPGAVPLLAYLRRRKFVLVVVSNQSGVARGLISVSQAQAVHQRFLELLREQQVSLDAVLYCPHGPNDKCPCRKPLPGMLLEAAGTLGVDLKKSYMVGDKMTDCEAGAAAGCKPILIGEPRNENAGWYRQAADLLDVRHLMQHDIGCAADQKDCD